MTFATPLIAAAAVAAPPDAEPATRTSTLPPSCEAAVTTLNVAGRMPALSCSAMTRAFDASLISDHLRFILQLGDERRHVRYLDPRATLGRLADLERLEVRLDVDAEIGRLQHVHLLLLGLHDVRQGNVAPVSYTHLTL